MIMKCKDPKDFMQEIIEDSAEEYELEFIDYKEKIIRIYPWLNLCKIRVVEKFERGMESKEKEAINTEEIAIETPKQLLVFLKPILLKNWMTPWG